MIKKRHRDRFAVKVALLCAVAAIGLTGCGDSKSAGMDPIDWYRDLSGDSKNDIQDKAANSKNLNEGSKEPYPNLASVPKQPENVITKADRDKMAQGLAADRQNAQYTDQQLRAGQNLQAVAPPPPEAPASKVAAVPAPAPVPALASTRRTAAVASAPASTSASSAPPRAAPVTPVKQESLPSPQRTAAANPSPAPASASPAPKTPQMAAAAPRSPAPPPQEQRADVTSPASPKPKKDDTRKRQEQVKRGSEQAPEESSLRPPSIGVMPEGQEAQQAPPPPVSPAAPKRAARPSRSEEVAEAAPSRSDVESSKGGVRTIEIKFTPGPFKARILPADHNRLVEVAKLAERNKARVRIVGYGGAPAQGDVAQREFQSFNAALDNAKAVGIELAKLGVPASRIDIETKANVNSPDRAEIFVEY